MNPAAAASGFASPEGTARYAARFSSHASFYRAVQGLHVSTLGIGSYLGEQTPTADHDYERAMSRAIAAGINFIDTALNYRDQHSERNIGVALKQAFASGLAARDELVICTKAGFLVPNATPSIPAGDIVGRMHSMAPAFLRDQIERSRANLGIDTLDVLYLHNPETQLQFIDNTEFEKRMRTAFEALEESAALGRIRYYGTATWNGYRQLKGGLSLTRLEAIARDAGGVNHRFRFIQLPLNLGMLEAFSQRDANGRNVLDTADSLGITAVASASILQARLASNLPPVITERMTGLNTDAQRAIQFTRSTPGISVALVGMGQAAHVEENLGIARVPPLTHDQFAGLFR